MCSGRFFWWSNARSLQSIYLISFSRLDSLSFHFRFLAIFAYWVLAEPLIRLVRAPNWILLSARPPLHLSLWAADAKKVHGWPAEGVIWLWGCRFCTSLTLSLSLLAASFIWGYTYPRAPSVINHIHSFVDFLFSPRALGKRQTAFFPHTAAIFNIIILLYWMGRADMRFFRISSTHSPWLVCAY